MERIRFLSAFELLAGVVLGAPAAVFAFFMFPNVELLASEQFEIDRLTYYDRLHHHWTFGSQILGYVALVFAFFLKPTYRVFLRTLLLVGLAMGITASLLFGSFDIASLLYDFKALRWATYTGANLFFFIYSLLLAAAGVSLFLKHVRFSHKEPAPAANS